MNSKQEYIDKLMNKFVYLCEIRGQLDSYSNHITEVQIADTLKLVEEARLDIK